MKYYLVRYRIIAGEAVLSVHHSEKSALEQAIALMQSGNSKIMDIHELNYGAYNLNTTEMQVIIENGRFKLKLVEKVEKE